MSLLTMDLYSTRNTIMLQESFVGYFKDIIQALVFDYLLDLSVSLNKENDINEMWIPIPYQKAKKKYFLNKTNIDHCLNSYADKKIIETKRIDDYLHFQIDFGKFTEEMNNFLNEEKV